MAIVKTVEIKFDSKQAEKNLKAINSTIDEQRDILVLLEEEYIKSKKALDDYNKSGRVNLAQEKQLKQAVSERKDALTDQRLGLKKLAIEQRAATSAVKEGQKAQKDNTNIVRAIDKLTGGYATKLIKLKKGFVSGVKGIKGFIGGLSGVKKAVIGTGIGALVVLVGTLVANFDKIKETLFGISKQSTDAAKAAEENATASQEQLDALNATENILRAQGLTEKEITELKKRQTEETITALEAQLEAQKTIRQEQIDTAKRNQSILVGILNFIAAPIKAILSTVDAVGSAFGKDFGLAAGVDKLTKSAASLIFDPNKIDEEGDEAIKETERKLLQLRDKRAAFDVKEASDRKKNKEKELQEIERKNKEKLRLEDEYQNRLKNLKDRIREAEANTQEEQRVLQMEKLKEENLALMAEALANGLLNEELVTSLRQREKDLQAQFSQEDADFNQEIKEKKQKELDAEQARIKAQEEYKEKEYREGYNNLQTIISAGGKKLEKVGKALAIADVVRSSYKSVSETISNTGIANAKAVAASPLTGGLPFVAINTAKAALSIGATVAGATKSIQAIKGDSKGVGASSTPSGGGGGAAPTPPSFNVIGATGTSQLAESIAGQTQEPVKAYVVSNDVTSAQSLDRNIVEEASI